MIASFEFALISIKTYPSEAAPKADRNTKLRTVSYIQSVAVKIK